MKSGDVVCLTLHLLHELPRALQFYARLEAVTGAYLRFVFLHNSQHVSDMLEKILFRYHRRKIAQQKSEEKTLGEGD